MLSLLQACASWGIHVSCSDPTAFVYCRAPGCSRLLWSSTQTRWAPCFLEPQSSGAALPQPPPALCQPGGALWAALFPRDRLREPRAGFWTVGFPIVLCVPVSLSCLLWRKVKGFASSGCAFEPGNRYRLVCSDSSGLND